MKKFITILIAGLIALTLVACAEDVNARATIPNAGLEISGTRISFRVNLIDPDEILTDGQIIVNMTGPEFDETQKMDSWVAGNWRRFTFEGLKAGESFSVTITAETTYNVTITLLTREFNTVEVGQAEDVPIEISTAEEFFSMPTFTTSTHFRIVNDIDFEEAQVPIMFSVAGGLSRFNHHLDGGNFTLSNLRQTDADIVNGSYLSIFGFIRDGSIRNLVLDNVVIDNTANPTSQLLYAGILASRIDSINAVIDNVTIKNSQLIISRPSATGRNMFLGTVVGAAQGTITNVTVSNTKVDANITNLVTGLTAIAGNHIGGAIGLVETNRGQAIYNLDIDVDLSVSINATRSGAEPAVLNIGGVVGFHRGMHGVAAIALSNVIARGSVEVELSALAGTGTRNIWVGIGGVIGNFDAMQVITNIVAQNDVSINTAPSDATAALQIIYAGAMIGRTMSSPASLRGLISYDQVITINSTSVPIDDNNPDDLIVTMIYELINFERQNLNINYDEITIRFISSEITVNNASFATQFVEITIDDIGNFITDQWVLDRLSGQII